MGSLFGSSTQETTQKTEIPEWLERSAKTNIGQAQEIASRPYETYDAARIAPFTQDQLSTFDFLRGYAPEALAPSGHEGQVQAASTAPVMQYANPTLLDNIPGVGGESYSLQDYMNPYIENVLQDSLGEMNRQAGIARKGIDTGATMAGAFGDAGHGIQQAEFDRNQTALQNQQINRSFADAFNTAMGLKGQDLNRQLAGFQTNAQQYEGGLDRAISGAQTGANIGALDQRDMLQYLDTLYKSGATQQAQGQQSADLAYQDFLRQFGYPEDLLNILNQTTAGQPHGKTTTSEQPGPSPFSSILGGIFSGASAI